MFLPFVVFAFVFFTDIIMLVDQVHEGNPNKPREINWTVVDADGRAVMHATSNFFVNSPIGPGDPPRDLNCAATQKSTLDPLAKSFVPNREFPSLSAGVPQNLSQAHHQNAGQTAWANQRASQPTPVQRPQQGPGHASQQTNQAQETVQQTLDDAFFPASQYGGTQQGNNYSSTHLHTSSIDDFPPLGRSTHGEIGQDRRGSLAPASGFGGFPSNPTSAFGQHSNYMPSRASELGDAPGLERRAFPGRDGGFGMLLHIL